MRPEANTFLNCWDAGLDKQVGYQPAAARYFRFSLGRFFVVRKIDQRRKVVW